MSQESNEIGGVLLVELAPHRDARGTLVELHRATWPGVPAVQQWNLVQSEGNVLRGVHVHNGHADFLTVLAGEMLVGLHDARVGSRTFGSARFVRLTALVPRAICIPPGVAHGFYTDAPCTYLYGLSAGWELAGEFGCRWSDPALGLDWPCRLPILSARDATAGTYTEMLVAFTGGAPRGDA